MPSQILEAAHGLTLHLDATPHARLAWGESDWLGPIKFMTHGAALQPLRIDAIDGRDDLGSYRGADITWAAMALPLRTRVRAYADVPVIVFRIEASAALANFGSGRFDHPSVAWPACVPSQRLPAGVPDGTRSYGHQYTEFALPVSGDARCTGFLFAPHRPPVVEPLMLIAPDGRTLLLAPLDQFHEQIITVPADREHADDGVRCGWHGDLSEVPAGFATELAVWASASPRQALTAWADCLRRRHGTQRPSRYADDLLGKLSYWTDNGAVYYYRTAPDCDYSTTLERAVTTLHAADIPVRSVQIDSWFYPHQNLRPVSAEGAPIVPPSGMMTWEPRQDLFPDGFHDLRRRLQNLPLTFHSRHFSSQSPYFEHYAAWRDGEYAHPQGSGLFARLMEQATSWGAITYEQDWMVESFLGVRGLRAAPGRARAWQQTLDHAAGEHGLMLQWCMATPADFMQTVSLQRIASIRTSGDYRYLFDNGLNWVWFLHTNALARAFGLAPFKDVFLSHGPTASSSGEPYAEVEALLAALSAGPVAIGDEIGCTNREIVMRTCREDGVLIKPDVPLAALDRCFRANSFVEHAPLIAEAFSAHPAGHWVYLASFNASRAKQPLHVDFELADLGPLQPPGPLLAYDWRARTWTRLERDGGWRCTLAFQDWDYRVLCPLLAGEITVFGDVTKYATVGDRRIAGITSVDDGIQFTVLGAPRTWVEVHGYARTRPAAMHGWEPGAQRTIHPQSPNPEPEWWTWNADDGRWIVRVNLGGLGHACVSIKT